MLQRLKKLDSIFTENEQVFNEFMLFNIFICNMRNGRRVRAVIRRRY